MKRLTRYTILLLIFITIIGIAPGITVLAENDIVIEIDGVRAPIQGQQPVIADGRVLVPVRGVFEALGFSVNWNQERRTVSLINERNTVVITEGHLIFTNNEIPYELDVPAQIINERMMLPLRALIESVGYYAYWDPANRAVLVFTGGPVDGLEDVDKDFSYDEDDYSATDHICVRHPGTLPPPQGRKVVPDQPFGGDIYYNPDVIFHGGFYIDGDSVSKYLGLLNSFSARMPESVRVFNLLVPSHVEFLDERYSAGVFGQREPIERIYDKLKGIIPVDAYSAIARRACCEYLYFRTDHHWTALGAYYGYLAFAEAAGFDPVTIYEYTEFAIPRFIGSYGMPSPNSAIRNSPDTLYYYKLDKDITFSRNLFTFFGDDGNRPSYKIFLGGDVALIDFTSSNKNGRTLIVIKDSFANALVPWAAPHYERVVVLDQRFFNGDVSEFLGDSPDADILILHDAHAPSFPIFVENIARVIG